MPLDRFQLVYDFHGSDLGTSGNGSSGKTGFYQICDLLVRTHGPLYNRHQVEDVFILLQPLVLMDTNSAGLTNLSQVIAEKIDYHREFSCILGTLNKFF